jgi:hypothetical protein
MDLKIAVTPKGYDDIGAVMRQLEYPFEQVAETLLYDASRLAEFDVLFINCSSNSRNHATKAGKALERYVADGGTIYASDYASDYIAAAFPLAIQFAGRHGSKGKLTARVVDKGLCALMGETIQLAFDMGSWEQIEAVEKGVQVYIEHAGRPILVSFTHGRGQVIYTCFHNHAQVTKQEAELLRYLVIKPLMARASAELVDLAWREGKEAQETVGTVAAGQVTPWYEYEFTEGGTLTAMLNWKGDALLRLEVQGPDGSWEEGGNTPPVVINIPSARRGRWRYRVTGQDVPVKNFPFVILIGPGGQINLPGIATPPASIWEGMVRPAVPVDVELLDSIRVLDSGSASGEDIEIRILDE